MKYQPPYTITLEILNQVAAISEAIGLLIALTDQTRALRLRRINRIRDGNGRMGRLWQSLILARWNSLFADTPVESLTFEHQTEYYQAIQESTQKTDPALFIAFMLRMILDTVTSSTPEVTPEVRLLSVLAGEMTRQQLKKALGLKDDEHFRKAYLLPALEARLLEGNDYPRQAAQQQAEISADRQGPPGDAPAQWWIACDKLATRLATLSCDNAMTRAVTSCWARLRQQKDIL